MVSDFSPTRPARIYLAVTAIVGWYALIAQCWLMLGNQVVGTGESLVRFFSYFTILTNILVTVAATLLALGRGRWFRKPSVQCALAVYIFVVGLTYNLVLRGIWEPKGMQRIVDELLHVGMPLLYLFYWFIWTPKTGIRYSHIPRWLIYPALYAGWILLWGALTDWYPYPFMDVVSFGYPRVLVNSGVVLAVFLIASALAILAGKTKK